MDTFTQPKITGYRQLSADEAALMNEGKAWHRRGDFITKLRTYADQSPWWTRVTTSGKTCVRPAVG